VAPADALPELAFDHDAIVLAGRERLRAKLSYSNVGFALAPPRFTIAELRAVYRAALGHDVSATNLQRVLLRRGVLEPTGEARTLGRVGGRPAAPFRFCSQRLEIRPVRRAPPAPLSGSHSAALQPIHPCCQP
jgi:8-oxo-dGTP diphosphatase